MIELYRPPAIVRVFAVAWSLMSVVVAGFFAFGLLAAAVTGELPVFLCRASD